MNLPDWFTIEREKSKSEIEQEKLEAERIRKRQAELRDRFLTLAGQNHTGVSTFNLVEEKPRAVTDLDENIDSAISGAMPQMLPEPEKEPWPAHLKPFYEGIEEKRPDWKTMQHIIESIDASDESEIIQEDDDGNWAGTFQQTLKPASPSSVNLSFAIPSVSIGNPQNGLTLNCIENSEGKIILFKNNATIVMEAIDRFNREYDEKTKGKIVLAGESNKEYANFHLTFDSLDYSSKLGISANFENYKWVAGSGNKMSFPPNYIRETCQFFLQGEIILDETETKIEAMTISSLSYINPKRMKKSERFVYVS